MLAKDDSSPDITAYVVALKELVPQCNESLANVASEIDGDGLSLFTQGISESRLQFMSGVAASIPGKGPVSCDQYAQMYLTSLEPSQSTPASSPNTLPTTLYPDPAENVSCTTTSSGTCIRGGEFCPEADEGENGTDAGDQVYVCRDSDGNGHPHWEIP